MKYLIYFLVLISSASVSKSQELNQFTVSSVIVPADETILDFKHYKQTQKRNTFLSMPYRNLVGAAFGPETFIGPQISTNIYPFKDYPYYAGLHYGLMFPTITIAGNIGYHFGADLGPFFFELSHSYFIMLNPSGGDSKGYSTINYKLGVRIYSVYLKVGPGFFQGANPFDHPFFLAIEKVPLNIEIGKVFDF